ncbi:MAG: metal-dependent hydrolase [Candidatus Marinimicrobia bacterium]|nr:metal-dependent hydrolase [Candidatus Neomarinimicrobiota bacterium]
MFFPSHIASGYLLGKSMNRTSWTAFPFLPVLLLSSVLPDVDGLFSTTVAGHHSVLHTPIFWIMLFGGMVLFEKWKKQKSLKPISWGIFLGAQLHLITDWLTARTVGIKWLYPYSEKDYFLYQIQPKNGQGSIWEMVQNPYFSFYMENRILFWSEVGVILLAGTFLLSRWEILGFNEPYQNSLSLKKWKQR